MSSVLNVSNYNKPVEFNLKYADVLVNGEEQHWFKRAHIGKFWD